VAELTRSSLEDGLVSVEIGGEFDISDADEARDLIIGSMGGAGLLLDLTPCVFIDSSGIRVLIETFDRARESEMPLAIAGSGPQVWRIFELTGLLDALPIFSERDTAVRFLTETTPNGGPGDGQPGS
jgi:anti-anti-sigma factor